MNIYFSDFFNISKEIIDDYGALNVSLINDLPLFIDPFLLFNSSNPTYKDLHDSIINYMIFLKNMSAAGSISTHLLDSWFTFPEVHQNWLGFSRKGNKGHGLGITFATALNRNLKTIFRDFGAETICKSSHLEKLCLINNGIGRDNISDFTTNLIKNFLAQYTETFAKKYLSEQQTKEVCVSKAYFNYTTRTWASKNYILPYIQNAYVLLTPLDILTKEEVWINRTELINSFSKIADSLPNEVLRAQVNEYLLRVLASESKLTKKEIQKRISFAIDKFPEVIDYYIKKKEEDGDKADVLSKRRVTEVKTQFIDNVSEFVDSYLEGSSFYENHTNSYTESYQRILFLKNVIENKGGHRLFYIDDNPIGTEENLQLIFRLTWFATSSDISREVNDGRGPVDFKASKGQADKTLIEFKLAKNTQLERNLIHQCEIYEKASDSTHPSIKVILYFSKQEYEKVLKILKKLGLEKDDNIILIDARSDNKPSGSKAK
jgi:hypothetical protein